MKIASILFSLFIIASISYAETYKWEDSNGMHFTDNAASVPAKYRAKTYESVREDIKTVKPAVYKPLPRQSSTIAVQKKDEDIVRANAERKLLAIEAMKQQQSALNAKMRIQTAEMEQKVFRPLAKFTAFMMIIGVLSFFIWLGTLLDIITSEFKDPSNKIVWILLVLCLAPLGVILFFLIGRSQKVKSISKSGKVQAGLASRLHPKERVAPRAFSTKNNRRDELFGRLLSQVLGDREKAQRLIRYSQDKNPGFSEIQCIEAASRSLEADIKRWD